MLVISNVSKNYNNNPILNNINLTIKKGEILGLLGPNGAGKSTLMKIILNLVSFDSGEIKFDSNDMKTNLDVKIFERIGAMIESPKLYTYMTGYENLYYFSLLHKDINKERIYEVASQLKIDKALNKKVKYYSLGMKQRLGIAQSILHKPSLLILDEPMNGLDPEGMYELRTYLKEISDSGTSILISSHLLSEMELLCDRVAILHEKTINKVFDIKEMKTDQKQYKTIFEVSSVQIFIDLIKELFELKDVEVIEDEENCVSVFVSKNEIAMLSRHLLINKVDVYKIVPQVACLEENYLSLVVNERG